MYIYIYDRNALLVAGVLRGEKVELAACVKKQQARIHHLQEALEEASKQVGLAGALLACYACSLSHILKGY